tara:strand:- start:4914 stop:5816 length:903 start_codon:yes stop_codon:yes gene_type:complete
MALSEEFIKDNSLDLEIVSKIDAFYSSNVIPSLKKEWDGKANTDAEGILTGASKYAAEKFGITSEREQGEKFADYLNRVSDLSLQSKVDDFKTKELELETKLKNFKGDDELKIQLEQFKEKNDGLLQKIAKLEPLEGFDTKYKSTSEELQQLKLSVAFDRVKPNFPDTVNKYESSAKWSEFKKSILEGSNIEIIDNIPYAVDKDNPHKKVKLSELVDADSTIKELLQGRKQQGSGATSVNTKKVDGIPFDVPQNASSEELTKLVQDHLTKTLKLSSPVQIPSDTFLEMYTKVRKASNNVV